MGIEPVVSAMSTNENETSNLFIMMGIPATAAFPRGKNGKLKCQVGQKMGNKRLKVKMCWMEMLKTFEELQNGKRRKRYKGGMRDFERSMDNLIGFGKLIGLIPANTAHCHWVGVAFPVILGLNAIMDIIGVIVTSGARKSASELGWAVGSPLFYLTGTFAYFHSRYQKLEKIFLKWHQLRILKEDKSLKRDVNLFSGLILLSAIVENVVFHAKLFPIFDRSPEQEVIEANMTFLQTYYIRSHQYWAKLIPYSPFTAVLLFLTNKLALYSWNFMDIFIIVMCRALYFRFSVLLLSDVKIKWRDFRTIYMELVDMLELFEDFLSPMIFVTYGMNLYAMCMQLHLGLTLRENTNCWLSLYSIWSFVHLTARIIIVTVTAAKINESSMKILRTKIHNCPMEEFSLEIERLESLPTSRTLGLTGLGMFTVTKKFLISIISVAFTFEMVLLQPDSGRAITL